MNKTAECRLCGEDLSEFPELNGTCDECNDSLNEEAHHARSGQPFQTFKPMCEDAPCCGCCDVN